MSEHATKVAGYSIARPVPGVKLIAGLDMAARPLVVLEAHMAGHGGMDLSPRQAAALGMSLMRLAMEVTGSTDVLLEAAEPRGVAR